MTLWLSSKRKSHLDPRIELAVSFISFISSFILMMINTTALKTCACADEMPGTQGKKNSNSNKKQEPGSTTCRRSARAAHDDEYRQDFGPRIAYTKSLRPCVGPRWGRKRREMSAPRPYKTYPFHLPALFTPYTKTDFYMYTKLFQLLLPRGICMVSWNIISLLFAHAPFQNHLF